MLYKVGTIEPLIYNRNTILSIVLDCFYRQKMVQFRYVFKYDPFIIKHMSPHYKITEDNGKRLLELV